MESSKANTREGYAPVSKTEQIQGQVDEVIDIVKTNIDLVQKRGETLDSLSSKTKAFQENAEMFKKSAVDVRKKMWWKNVKMMVILGCILVVLALVITFAVLNSVGVKIGGSESAAAPVPNPTAATVESSDDLAAAAKNKVSNLVAEANKELGSSTQETLDNSSDEDDFEDDADDDDDYDDNDDDDEEDLKSDDDDTDFDESEDEDADFRYVEY